MPREDVYFSVDWETDGPVPGIYSGVAVGACVVTESMIENSIRPSRENSFKAYLKPISDNWIPAALAACNLDRNWLMEHGEDPYVVMRRYRAWVAEQSQFGHPVLVGFNVPFDWSFNHYYMEVFSGGHDILGISAPDEKAYLMSLLGLETWSQTSKRRLNPLFLSDRRHTHDPLDDALEQAEIWIKARKFARNPAIRRVVEQELEKLKQVGGFVLH